MDGVDLALLSRLSKEPLAAVAALAREAKLTSNAARARLDRLREQGVLMGVYAFPNPALFGRTTRIAIYAPPKRGLRPERTLEIDGVVSYSVNHDGQLAVTYYAKGAADPPPAALDKLVGASAPRVYVRESPPLSPPGAVLSRDQWRLVEAMVADPRATARRLSEATGLSEKVAARHRAKLLAGSYVTLVTGILSNLAEGIVLFHLFVAGPGTRDERAIVRPLGGAIVQERTRDPDGLYVFCSAATIGDALVARDVAAKLPGVEHVEIVLERAAAVATDRVIAMCRAMRDP